MAATTTTRATARLGHLVALAIAAILAACAGAPASSASPDEPDASSPAAEATASATPSASQSSAPSSAPTIAPDADLAALLPTTVAGTEFTVTAYSGEEAGGLSFGRVGAIATSLGIAVTDLDAAIAVGPDWDPNLGPEVLAIRYRGAHPAAILEEVAPAFGGVQFAAGSIEVTDEAVGGKDVSVMEVEMMGGGTTAYHFYAIGDVVFIVNTPDPAEAEDALSQLP